MAVMKRLIILLLVVSAPLLLGLLVTYDFVKIEWVSMMEIQPSYDTQEDPLPLPERSVPIQGAYNSPQLGPPDNNIPPTENSLMRGQYYYEITCLPCHGPAGDGKGPFAIYLRDRPPLSLLAENAKNLSDGEIFVIISNGIEGAMPAMRQNLPDEEMRWSVVNYVRSLQAGSAGQ